MTLMSNRLTQIPTRTGDDGTPGLGDGSRLAKIIRACRRSAMSKSSIRPSAYLPSCRGDVRELWSCFSTSSSTSGRAADARFEFELPKVDAVRRPGEALAHYNAVLPRLNEFIFPAGTRSAALAHIGRTVARRTKCAVAAPALDRYSATCCSW